MDEFSGKIKRVKPLIKARQGQLNNEAAILSAIRRDKMQAFEDLKNFENQYIAGIDGLNKERQSATRDRLDPMESGLDYVKALWYRSLKRLREIEEQEKAQVAQLLIAERNLKSVEKLEERYVEQSQYQQKIRDQKQTDEVAIRKFAQRK